MRNRAQSMFASERELEDRYFITKEKDDSADETRETEKLDSVKDWTTKNELALVNKLKVYIPKNDNIAFDERLDGINWQKITFDGFTEVDVKSKFKELLENTRTFRLLGEILADMRREIFSKLELPLKPKSAFTLFLTESKGEIKEKCNSDGSKFLAMAADCFKNLSDEKKEEYANRTLEMKNNYRQVVDKLNLDLGASKKTGKKLTGPLYEYYTQKYLDGRKGGRKDVKLKKLKQEYALLSQQRKISLILKWLNIEEGKKLNKTQYENAKKMLNKDDMALLDEYEGKPRKCTNGYTLFLQDIYQNSTDHKVAVADAASKWKSLASDIKELYLAKGALARKQYNIDYMNYVNSLPLDRNEWEKTKKRKRRGIPNTKINGKEQSKSKSRKNQIENYFASNKRTQTNGENDVSSDEETIITTAEKKKKKRDKPKQNSKLEEVFPGAQVNPTIEEMCEAESTTPKRRKQRTLDSSENEVSPKKRKKRTFEIDSKEIETQSIFGADQPNSGTEKEGERKVKKAKKKKNKKEDSVIEETNVAEDATYNENPETVTGKIEKLLALKPPKSCYKYFLKKWSEVPKKEAKSHYKSLSADEKKSINKKYKRAKRKFLENFQIFANSLSSQELEENEEVIEKILEDQGDPSDESEEES